MDDRALEVFRVMTAHLLDNRQKLEAMRNDVIEVLHAHNATLRDVVALIGFMLARIERQEFDVGEILAALQLAHDQRRQREAADKPS